MNELYLAADLLITDYSSVFFDYANLERPILFYMYDYESYKHEMRDFYLDIHILPGPVVKTQEELLTKIKNLDGIVDEYREKYRIFNEMFNPHRGVQWKISSRMAETGEVINAEELVYCNSGL